MSTDTFAEASDPVTIVAEPSAVDPEAPYGRFQSGRPRKSPAKQRKGTGSGPKPPTPRAPRKPAAAARKLSSFTPLLTRAFRTVGTAVLGLGVRQQNGVLVADGQAIRHAAPALGQGLNEIVQTSPRLQQLLGQAGPTVVYLDFGMAVVGLIAQLAANHGKPVPMPGVRDPQELVNEAEAELAAQMRAAQKNEKQEDPAPEPAPEPVHTFAGV